VIAGGARFWPSEGFLKILRIFKLAIQLWTSSTILGTSANLDGGFRKTEMTQFREILTAMTKRELQRSYPGSRLVHI
jgi:hypothetical protein